MKNLSLTLLLFITLSSSNWVLAKGRQFNLQLDFDTDTPIASTKTVGLRAQCILNEDGKSILRIYGTTILETGVVLDGSDNFQGDEGKFLSPETIPGDAELLRARVETGETYWDNDPSEGFLLDTSRLTDINRVTGFVVAGEQTILGITPNGCYVSVKLIKPNKKFKKAKDSELLVF